MKVLLSISLETAEYGSLWSSELDWDSEFGSVPGSSDWLVLLEADDVDDRLAVQVSERTWNVPNHSVMLYLRPEGPTSRLDEDGYLEIIDKLRKAGFSKTSDY